MEVRLAKIVMTASLAAFTFLVTFGNITDYGSNFAFVQHVLSMDTTFPGNALMWRAVTSETLWHVAYAGIIAAEGTACVLFTIAMVMLLKALRGPAADFQHAKRWVVLGVTVGFLVWFFGFMVVGGEWFAMWQSSTWNGQDAAFRFYMTMLAVLIFVMMPERETAGRAP